MVFGRLLWEMAWDFKALGEMIEGTAVERE
jgi:hypothetical protein